MSPFGRHVDGYYHVEHQIVNDLRRRAEANFRRQGQEKAALTTIEAFEVHRARVRQNFLRAIGGLPTERTPLNVRLIGTIECEKYTIEKLIYESMPEFYVTAACYVPKGLKDRAPAVVCAHGHTEQSKSYHHYQKVAIDLANNGFVVLAVDPIGQGERAQYYERFGERGEKRGGASVYEHMRGGFQFLAHGANIARVFIWDIMRSIDYLETRPDVDASRIGMTGNSGGGTQTSLLMMSEPRLAAAVPCTFIMTLESYLKTGQAQDSEQLIHNCFVAGPDHDDFITAMAPRPALVAAVNYDFFPIEGSYEAVRRARQIYKLYGKEENVDIATDNSLHQYTAPLRQACVNWFKKHFRGEPMDFVTGELQPLPEADLWSMQTGQMLGDFPNGRTVYELNRELLAPPVPVPPSERRAALAEALGVNVGGDRTAPIYPRVLRNDAVTGFPCEHLFFLSTAEIVVTGVMIHPPDKPRDTPLPATLLLLQDGTNDLEDAYHLVNSYLQQGQRVFAFDVRGIGGVSIRDATTRGSDSELNDEFKLACDADLLGISLLGLRIFDVLRAFEFLRGRSDVTDIHLHGRDSGAIFAFYAAVLEERFASLTCERLPYSYRDFCETKFYDNSIYNMRILAWGILRHGDLPDLLPCLAPRAVTFIQPRNARGELVDAADFRRRYIEEAHCRSTWPAGWEPQYY